MPKSTAQHKNPAIEMRKAEKLMKARPSLSKTLTQAGPHPKHPPKKQHKR